MSDWQPIMFAPRDGTPFEARDGKGMTFSCRYDTKKARFVNIANGHSVNPKVWRSNEPPEAA